MRSSYYVPHILTDHNTTSIDGHVVESVVTRQVNSYQLPPKANGKPEKKEKPYRLVKVRNPKSPVGKPYDGLYEVQDTSGNTRGFIVRVSIGESDSRDADVWQVAGTNKTFTFTGQAARACLRTRATSGTKIVKPKEKQPNVTRTVHKTTRTQRPTLAIRG